MFHIIESITLYSRKLKNQLLSVAKADFSVFLGLQWALLGLLCVGCKSDFSTSHRFKGEYIVRHSNDSFVELKELQPEKRQAYPWEEGWVCDCPKITKNYFRCQGSALNPYRIIERNKSAERLYDCGGPQKHSLPIKDQEEFIYPILIDLLNHIQSKTGKRVIITCGHCCPEHNAYLSPTGLNIPSKHMIGAEVDFYVQGMEYNPQEVVELIFNYYKDNPKYEGKKEFIDFKRIEKNEKDQQAFVIAPWANKEIYIKILTKNEGRDFDNRHPYPYICIQVRYDMEKRENVFYSWEQAFYNLYRS